MKSVKILGGQLPCIQALTPTLLADYGKKFVYCLAPKIINSTILECQNNRTCVVPEIFFIENQSVIRLELSAAPTTKAVFTMAEGG